MYYTPVLLFHILQSSSHSEALQNSTGIKNSHHSVIFYKEDAKQTGKTASLSELYIVESLGRDMYCSSILPLQDVAEKPVHPISLPHISLICLEQGTVE